MYVFSRSVVTLAPREFKEPAEEKGTRYPCEKENGEKPICDVARCPGYGSAFLHLSVWRRSHDLTVPLRRLLRSFVHDRPLTFTFTGSLTSTCYIQLLFVHITGSTVKRLPKAHHSIAQQERRCSIKRLIKRSMYTKIFSFTIERKSDTSASFIRVHLPQSRRAMSNSNFEFRQRRGTRRAYFLFTLPKVVSGPIKTGDRRISGYFWRARKGKREREENLSSGRKESAHLVSRSIAGCGKSSTTGNEGRQERSRRRWPIRSLENG